MDSHSIMWGYTLVFQVKQIYFLQIQRIQRKTNEGGKQLDGMDKKKKKKKHYKSEKRVLVAGKKRCIKTSNSDQDI